MQPPFKAVGGFILAEVSFNEAEEVLEAVKMIFTLIHILRDSHASSILSLRVGDVLDFLEDVLCSGKML